MKEYYETKLARCNYILAATDKQIQEDLKAAVTCEDIEHVAGLVANLMDTRALITDEIAFCTKSLAEIDSEKEAES